MEHITSLALRGTGTHHIACTQRDWNSSHTLRGTETHHRHSGELEHTQTQRDWNTSHTLRGTGRHLTHLELEHISDTRTGTHLTHSEGLEHIEV